MAHPANEEPRRQGLIGGPIDDFPSALVVCSARRPMRGELQDLVRLVQEMPELLDVGEDLSLVEQLRSELTWRLLEWRHTREPRAHAALRLLRAS